jgi:hypothetical protein
MQRRHFQSRLNRLFRERSRGDEVLMPEPDAMLKITVTRKTGSSRSVWKQILQPGFSKPLEDRGLDILKLKIALVVAANWPDG